LDSPQSSQGLSDNEEDVEDDVYDTHRIFVPTYDEPTATLSQGTANSVESVTQVVQDDEPDERPPRWWDNLKGAMYDEQANEAVDLGLLEKVCSACRALHFRCEYRRSDRSYGSCCNGGKVHLRPNLRYPELLNALLCGDHPKSKEFKDNITNYNAALAMAKFKCSKKIERLVQYGEYYLA
jgi:hypothetical protein